MLQAPVLLITRYRATTALDAVLAVQRYLGDRLLGVLINGIEEPQLDFVRSRIWCHFSKNAALRLRHLGAGSAAGRRDGDRPARALGWPDDRQPGLG